jgi:hypothetical protein
MNSRNFVLGLLLAVLPVYAQAAIITDLFNTGVDSYGNALPDRVIDPHYALTSYPGLATLEAVTTPNGYPIGPWAANNAGSRWIGPQTAQAAGPAGTYVYETSFTLAHNADLSTAVITGEGSLDDYMTNVVINGNSLGSLGLGWARLRSFTIDSGFVTGLNTLEFVVYNSGGPTGLRIDHIAGSYETVSEPSILALIASGLLGVGVVRRRKQKA